MKKIILLGIALLAMVSCEKYDDSDVWNAINDLKAKQENASKEGVTPVVKTVNEEMFISYDNGATWTKMSNGMYSEISYDERYVVFTLTDGTELKVLNANYVVPIEKGAIKAAFSVAEGKQVYFSQGNLQYQASTGVWRFATNQWETIGEGNANIAPDYDGWIDLFGWGTSGWNSGAVAFMPYEITNEATNYFVGDLTGTNADWGVYNKIINGGNAVDMWRTLTYEEWQYLVSRRLNASEKRGVAVVNGVNGSILLPDNWVLPEGLTFQAGVATEQNSYSYSEVNNYTLKQWMKMEDAGALFLPAGGYMEKGKIYLVGLTGGYWTTTQIKGLETNGANFFFRSNVLGMSKLYYSEGTASGNQKYRSISVRLVQDVK